MLASLIPAFIALVFLFIPVGVVFTVRHRDQQRKRSPLSRQLLRSPGESLRKELDDLMWDVAGYLMVLPLIPLVLYSTYLTQISIGGQPLKFSIILIVTGLLFIAFLGMMGNLERQENEQYNQEVQE